MTCPQCSTDFCWLCGQRISGGVYPVHYAPWNLAGCPNLQMAENWRAEGESNCVSTSKQCAVRVGYVFVAPVLGSLALAFFFLLLGLAVAWFFAAGVLVGLVSLPLYLLKRDWFNGILIVPLLPGVVLSMILNDDDD